MNTPTFERLAAAGLRYTRFHTTALCAPTRQALLTGRNHHTVGIGRDLRAGDVGTWVQLDPAEHVRPASEDHSPPLRVSGIQSGNFSGPVGSTVGQQP